MTDQFETRLNGLFRDYAELGVRPVDRFAIARASTATVSKPRAGLVARSRTQWSMGRTLVIAALLGLAIVAGLLFGGGHQSQPPQSSEEPSPSASIGPRPTVPVSSDGRFSGTIIIPVPSDNSPAMRYVAVGLDGTVTTLDIVGHARSCPTYSPDGRSLAYISFTGTEGKDWQEQLVIAKPDGSDPRVLWRGLFNRQTFHQVVWAPNSQVVAATLALSESLASGDQIVIGRRDTSSVETLDLAAGEFPGSIAWSPDGGQLAAIVTVDGTTQRIEIRDLNGGPVRTIVTAPSISSIAWSPDGSTIVYATSANHGPSGQDADDLYFVTPDGTDLRRIAPGSRGSERLVAWSPDGSLLAVTVFGGNAASGTFMTIIYDATGTEVHRLTGIPTSDNLAMTWSPDSRSLLFSLGGGGDISRSGSEMVPTIFPIDGSASRKLPVAEGGYYTQCPLAWAATTTP